MQPNHPTTSDETNWWRNIRYSADQLAAPRSVDELRRLLTTADQVKALGSRHSFNRIADTTTRVLVSTHALNLPTIIDPQRSRVRVGGDVRYGERAPRLDAGGWRSSNLSTAASSLTRPTF